MSADLLPPMKWNAWGDPDEAKPLSEGIRSLLAQALGVTGSPEAELEADQVQLRPSALTTTNREALAAMVLLITQSTIQSAQIVRPILNAEALATELAYSLNGYLS